jgi:transcriptional regulator with XRE-family HTH domain
MITALSKNKLEKLGSKIRQYRNEKKLSQEELAYLCGFDRTYISLVERGKRNLSFSNLCTFADSLNISLSELLEDI